MTREQLIDALITRSGAPSPLGSRSRARLASLDDSALFAMQDEIERAEAYGQSLNAGLGANQRLTEILLASETATNAWRSAVEAWSHPVSADLAAKSYEDIALSPVVYSTVPAPWVHEYPKAQGDTRRTAALSHLLIQYVARELSASPLNSRFLERVHAELDKPVADLLQIILLKAVTQVSDLVIDHVLKHGSIGYFDALAVATSRERGGALRNLRYYPDPMHVSDTAVRDGLARAAVCVRELAPTIVIPGPKSTAFGQFLETTCKRYGRVGTATTTKPSILVAMESADDPQEMDRVIRSVSEKYPGMPVRTLCLFGTTEVSQSHHDAPVWTMVATSGEPLDSPWDSSGGFELDDERMVFGTHTHQPFEVQMHDFERRLQSLEEQVGEPAE
jgi:hypothetical protein